LRHEHEETNAAESEMVKPKRSFALVSAIWLAHVVSILD